MAECHDISQIIYGMEEVLVSIYAISNIKKERETECKIITTKKKPF